MAWYGSQFEEEQALNSPLKLVEAAEDVDEVSQGKTYFRPTGVVSPTLRI
jgi:hypothetical protein